MIGLKYVERANIFNPDGVQINSNHSKSNSKMFKDNDYQNMTALGNESFDQNPRLLKVKPGVSKKKTF